MLPAFPPEQHPDAPTPAETSGPPEYEFTAPQNAVFATAAFWMEWSARVFIGFGGAAAVLAVLIGPEVWLMLEGTAVVVVGLYTWWVAAAFRRVERTSGRDITHVLTAVGDLGKMYAFQLLFIPAMAVAGVVITALAK